ncbi:PCI-domain-containing protein [Neoconidiobolus thromboides FSU 785]|nr:PCI-domain-containing protein [Neoconidiobolus thromboides FSU 785]
MSSEDLIYDDDASYDLEYSSQSELGEQELSLENRYYDAKSLVKEDPSKVIDAFEEIIKLEEGDGPFTFKSTKQLLKFTYRNGDLEKAMSYYQKILSFPLGDGVASTYKDSSINNMVDLISKNTNNEFLDQFFKDTIKVLDPVRNERSWIRTQLKLAHLWLTQKNFDSLRELLPTLYNFCKDTSGNDEERKGTHLLDIISIDMEIASIFKDNKKSKRLYERASNVKTAFASPRADGVIRECGGKMYMRESNYELAYKDFFKSFNAYNDVGAPQRLRIIKYIVLTSMLSNALVSPFDSPEMSQYRSHRECRHLYQLINAFQNKDSKLFEEILAEHSESLQDDPFVSSFFYQLTHTVRTQTLIKICKSFTQLKIEFIAMLLNLSSEIAMELIVNSLLDEDIKGHIDDVKNMLVLEHKIKQGSKRKSTYKEISNTLDNFQNSVVKKLSAY